VAVAICAVKGETGDHALAHKIDVRIDQDVGSRRILHRDDRLRLERAAHRAAERAAHVRRTSLHRGK
jgi:hypothetical protein